MHVRHGALWLEHCITLALLLPLLRPFTRPTLSSSPLSPLPSFEALRTIRFFLLISTVAHFEACLWFGLARMKHYGPDTWMGDGRIHGDLSGLRMYEESCCIHM